ncbi:hypothetical protein PILCRDRAFT_560323 [Piloderma croceum F 1598]|uniref:Uncharacterized protein n=1 Tax=Piloderma croceum (strain F 1598) TaxID=765440 RepID=A0A0C3B005_PILCF|nr:hypothetical protein PILCRDRAFT_560323 [Piloderma croceum F 1598]
MDQFNLKIFCKNCGISLLSHISVPSSLTLHLHRTCQAPNASESKMLRDVLLQAGSDLAQLDSEIDQVQAVLEALRQKREALLKFTAEHNAILAPICRLPLELLTDIFVRCLSSLPCRGERVNAKRWQRFSSLIDLSGPLEGSQSMSASLKDLSPR